jgi:hypothetical protein
MTNKETNDVCVRMFPKHTEKNKKKENYCLL